ncbi:MAG TPA: DUF1499 domain-containing protein [Afifellaceae bacterium]|nr:DUF1499 domain-containing protein [Afifellaceae bacterium]
MGARVTIQRSRAAGFARKCGALSIAVLVLTALGHRYGPVPEFTLLSLISTGIVLALLAMASGLYALHEIWKNGDEGAGSAVLATFYALPGTVLFIASVYALAVYPKLNDISTDPVSPPEFLSLTGEFAKRLEPSTQGQRLVQISAYPDITARLYPVDMDRVLQAVQGLVEQRGWPVVRQSLPAQSGQPAVIQVIARTLLFQFTDHVVIRLAREDGGTRVDLRSASTFGRHDLGQNARRIRALLDDLDLALQGERNDLQSASQ